MSKISQILGTELRTQQELVDLQAALITLYDKPLIEARAKLLKRLSHTPEFNSHFQVQLQSDIEQLFTWYELSEQKFLDLVHLVIYVYRLLTWLPSYKRFSVSFSLFQSIRL